MSSIWSVKPTLAQIHERNNGTMVSHLGIEFTEVGDDFLGAKMPVDERTKQPAGILHGGANVVLSETIGSVAANWIVFPQGKMAVGLEVNANHLRPVSKGYVYGVAKAVHLGKSTQVWEIRISDDEGKLSCISRLTMAIVAKP
ncbi:hotdog fold thioesterase [Permianibacter aggregans]|uniref:Uncharacterized protein (TIGR00369 family) n=1 Tax=Permianibacter aggregans TaxID=1510150 RepID=A0A4R6URB9_9GAMM|nr:hotdog fold thioesterase [Permianibacter aggregans]QGX40342.1 hotdog fold thioesterase [Permianibacter aggregans]TDQ49532.1 uncharacterized protein (TIGR00369 family) [Permianibacter aggregans]